MKILYVENHESFAKSVIQTFLPDHDVMICPTVAEALSLLGQSAWDVVLIDYDLDDGKGDEVARVASALPNKPRLIACSSHERGNQAILGAGAEMICSKMDIKMIGQFLPPATDTRSQPEIDS